MNDIKITSLKPNSRTSVEYIVKHIQDVGKKSNNLLPVWKQIEPDLLQAMQYEFSEANPNRWKGLSSKYLTWKGKHGYPSTTGIMTGATRESLTTSAKIKSTKKYLNWGMNPSIVNTQTHKKTGDYVKYFDRFRKIFVYTKKFMSKIFRDAVKGSIKEGWNERGK